MIDLSNYPLNPYRAGPPIKDEKMLFGRLNIFSQVHTHLVGELANHPIVIYGQRRMGKTSVLFQMERRLNAIEGQDRYLLARRLNHRHRHRANYLDE
jgi:predicted AAA+ superfamily ATPase